MVASLSVAITYVPADCGSIIPGKSKAPQAFQDVEIVNKLREAGIPTVSEHHALNTPARYAISSFAPGTVRNQSLNVDVCEKVYNTIRDNLNTPEGFHPPKFQLILGGECCMSPAILSAFWHHAEARTPAKRIGLLYIDADTDLASPNDPGFTGNLAGMNMTNLLGTPGAIPSMEQFSQASGEPVCDATNTVLFGINMAFAGNKPEHFAYLFDSGFKVISSAAVAREPEERAREALKYLEERVDVIMVHLDVDSIDPRIDVQVAHEMRHGCVGILLTSRALRFHRR